MLVDEDRGDEGEAEAVRWAAEAGVVASDEFRLEPAPHASLPAWCAARLASTAARLAAAPDLPTILINHWPLREDLIYLPNIPRYSLWCGTRATHDWHLRYRARVVVSGHLHTRRTDWIDGVRFEEVSLGYPRHWRQDLGIDLHLRTILPEPAPGHMRLSYAVSVENIDKALARIRDAVAALE